MNQIGGNGPQITAAQFAAKAKSKREVYTLLVVDCKAYLPNIDTLTIYFLKDLISGEKKCKCARIEPINHS